MRLSAAQIEAIKHEPNYFFGVQARACLFGSSMKYQRGFTLVELITVMVIIGILAVAALPRFFDNDAFQARGAADQVKAALRYGQKVAIAQRKAAVAVNITSPTSTSDCGTTLSVTGDVDCKISSKVTIADTTVTFNALGQPNAGASITVGSPPNDTTITVEAETGYVH